jgi:hypothetical protein
MPLSMQGLCDGAEKDGFIQTGIIFCRKYAEIRIFMTVYHRLHLALHLDNPLASVLKKYI